MSHAIARMKLMDLLLEHNCRLRGMQSGTAGHSDAPALGASVGEVAAFVVRVRLWILSTESTIEVMENTVHEFNYLEDFDDGILDELAVMPRRAGV